MSLAPRQTARTNTRSGGIGLPTVKYLALAGAKVYMATRSEKKARDAIDGLHRDNPTLVPGSIVFLELDLGSIKSVDRAAAEVLAQEKRFDILST